MRPDISEFSYGFALTYELIRASGSPIVAVPVFPSTTKEGQSGGGWDVLIQRPTAPLFLQFKLADYMKKSTSMEVRNGFPIPCYRMHLRKASVSQQHQLLLDLEASGEAVFYSAPAFHRPVELNAAFLATELRVRSMWLRPSEIGPLPDNKDHHVSFRLSGPWAFFSERRDLRPRTFATVGEELARVVRERGARYRTRQAWELLADTLMASAEREHMPPQLLRQLSTQDQTHPVERLAAHAQMLLGSQLFLVQQSESALTTRTAGSGT